MQNKSSLLGPTYTLVAIATLMLQFVMLERQGFLVHEWIQLALTVLAAFAINRSWRSKNRNAGRSMERVAFVGLAVLPFAADATQRAVSSFGNPFEIQLVLCLRNLMIGLCGKNDDARSLKVASMASAFLALYSFLLLMNRWTTTLMFGYAVIGMWWLMGAYWDRLSGCFLSHSERRVPWKPVLVAVSLGVVAALMSLPFLAGRNYTTAIQGFMPSSGGTGNQDQFAFGGVGDGPQMVSAKDNASSFGPIESELFLESQMPSLYDVFNEFSEPPPKPSNKPRQRAIPLAPSFMQANHQRRGTNQRASREFSAVRRDKQETPKTKDLRSRTLLQVSGRVPVHLGLYSYDTWDGRELTSSETSILPEVTLRLDVTGKKNWARLVGFGPNALLTHKDQHELRIINLETDRVPAPPNLSAVNIDRIHTETLFKPTSDGMLSLDMDHIPQLSILHVQSMQRSIWQTPEPITSEPDSALQSHSIARLAHDWTEQVESGWPQVEAVCRRLRQEYQLNSEAMVPNEAEDAAQYFLLESKQGPDYLFATSAALMLRTLGYETRVVSGFYADPKNYDRASRITSVHAEDAHFWVEVLTSVNGKVADADAYDAKRWVAVDPTPGYEVLLAPESLWSKLLNRAAVTWLALKRNPLQTIGFLTLIGFIWSVRVYLLDLAVTTWWFVLYRWGDIRQRVTSTVRLLERRARLHGCPRAKGDSLTSWSSANEKFHFATDDWRVSFLDLANWALYGEGIPSRYSYDQVNAICHQVASTKMSSAHSWRHKLSWFTRRAK